MFYCPQGGHVLPQPIQHVDHPRPVGWISSRDSGDITTLTPYSFFNGTAYFSPRIMVGQHRPKSGHDNTRTNGAFATRDVMSKSSAACGIGQECG